MPIDISTYSYYQWLDFIFDHPPLDSLSREERWYEKSDWEYVANGDLLAKNLIRLFNEPCELIGKYEYDQINHGFWFVNSLYGFSWILIDDRINWKNRKFCISSMEKLFDLLFVKFSIGSTPYMWWDLIISHCAIDGKNLETEFYVLKALLKVMIIVSKQPSKISKQSIQESFMGLHSIAYAI